MAWKKKLVSRSVQLSYDEMLRLLEANKNKCNAILEGMKASFNATREAFQKYRTCLAQIKTLLVTVDYPGKREEHKKKILKLLDEAVRHLGNMKISLEQTVKVTEGEEKAILMEEAELASLMKNIPEKKVIVKTIFKALAKLYLELTLLIKGVNEELRKSIDPEVELITNTDPDPAKKGIKEMVEGMSGKELVSLEGSIKMLTEIGKERESKKIIEYLGLKLDRVFGVAVTLTKEQIAYLKKIRKIADIQQSLNDVEEVLEEELRQLMAA